MMVRVVTDSCSDLTPELAQKFGIVRVPLYVNFGNKAYRDNVDISTEEFYHRLERSKIIHTTSTVTRISLLSFLLNYLKRQM